MTDTPIIHAGLAFLLREGPASKEVLLPRKKPDAKIGANTRNGPGGIVDPEDAGDPARATARELFEECNLTARAEDLELVAVVDFHNEKADGTRRVVRVHTYLLRQWEGEIHVTSEMRDPQWFPINQLPTDEMLLADKHWIPRVLAGGGPYYAQAHYGPGQTTLVGDVTIRPATLDELNSLRPLP